MIKKISETNSTNSYLKELVHVQLGQTPQSSSICRSIPEFFSVMANHQTNGRGQHNCYWQSEPYKNALFSTLLFPKIHPSQQFYLSKVVSLSILEYLKTLITDSHNLSIKWPNDIYYQNKKIAGILIENSIMGDQILYSIVGIGLNLNQQHFNSQLPNPISVSQITELTYDIDNAVKSIINIISFRYAIILEDITAYDAEYEKHLYKNNKEFEYEMNNQKFRARIKGVNEYGKLLLLKNNCEMLECGFKEVKFL